MALIRSVCSRNIITCIYFDCSIFFLCTCTWTKNLILSSFCPLFQAIELASEVLANVKFIQEKKLIGECFCLCHSHIFYNYSFFFFSNFSLHVSTCHLFSFGKAKKIPCLGRSKEVKKVKGIIIIIIN